MPHSRSTTISLFLLLCSILASSLSYGQAGSGAQTPVSTSSKTSSDQASAPAADPIPPDAQRISRQSRFEIIRDFETQLVYARTAFPIGRKGLVLKDGVITPNGEELRQALALWGPAVKPGDPAHISSVLIKNDHIHFEINGGPVRHKKWYQRIELSGANGNAAPQRQDDAQANPHGSFVDVYFGKYIPEMTPQQLRALLYPVLDFNARNKEEAYLDTVPPKVKQAIQAHRVLVGMDVEMVLHAKGKPPKKVREREGGAEYEEWIYGEPPADVDFVRIVEDEVVRVETMKIGGEKIVRTEREVVLPRPEKDKEKDEEAKKEPGERPAKAPTMRRPGEDSQDGPAPASGATPLPPAPPRGPDDPAPSKIPTPDGPGEILPSR
jgi:hypothetical protein